MDLIIPPTPEPPGPGATDTQIANYNQRVAIINEATVRPVAIAASQAHGAAQAATASAIESSVAAQLQMAAAMTEPVRLTDAEQTLEIVKALAYGGITGIEAVARARQTMAAYRLFFPLEAS